MTQCKGPFGEVQSIEWLHDGSQFVSSSDITKRNSIDRSILVWDFQTVRTRFDMRIVASKALTVMPLGLQGAILSNQVYLEAYTCPYLRAHPEGTHFVAQSNANYIAIFSAQAPYKLNKYKVK